MSYTATLIELEKEHRATAKKMIALAKKADDFTFLTEIKIIFSPTGALFKVNNFNELHEARAFLRSVYPGYKDKVTGIYTYYRDVAYASYDTGIYDIHLELYHTIEGFPIHKNGCGFKKQQSTGVEYFSYVCEKEVEG